MSGTDNQDPSTVSIRSDMLQTGMFFASRFRIVHSLGQGAMGKVYLASDLMLGEGKIALKILSSDLENDPTHLARFLREVQLTRQVTHPGVVRTFDIGNHNDCHYFTMEYIEGKTLAEMINGKACSPEKCIDILCQLCEGLCAIHELGIVHRDLKSSNVLITNQGQVKIADFGIARLDVSNLTIPDELVGSATHMAPEVWKQSEVTQSSDLYSLGVIAYELLTGALPFDGKTAYSMMWKHLKEKPSNPSIINSDIPHWLANLCLKLLSKDASERPPSARKVLEILKNAPKEQAAQKIQTSVAPPAKTTSLKALPKIDIWSPASSNSSNVNIKSENKTVENLKSSSLVNDKEKLIEASISISDYNLGTSFANEFSLRDPYIKQVMLSIIGTVILVLALIAVGNFIIPQAQTKSSANQLLIPIISVLSSVSTLSIILLAPFFLICSIMRGLRFGIKCLSKLFVLAVAIFLLIFACKLLSISQISASYDQKSKNLEAGEAFDASITNLSEVLILQTSPTTFNLSRPEEQTYYQFTKSKSPSLFQSCTHILYIAIILMAAGAIICNISNHRINNFKIYYLIIPIFIAVFTNWIFGQIFINQNLGWNITIGENIVFIKNYTVLTSFFIWSSVLICALASEGWKIKVK